MPIIDTHAHLDHIENLESALQSARVAGVEGIIAVGVDLASNKRNLDIKRTTTSPHIYLGLGIHPGNIKSGEFEECMEFMQAHVREAHVIGEIGLDFWYKDVRKDDARKGEQRRVFRRQLLLAKDCGLPVVVHARGTWLECLDTVMETGIRKAVFHWYSGPLDVLEKIIAAGYFVSASPAVAYSPPSREAIRQAPMEQTLIETDSPVFYRQVDHEEGFVSQPKDVMKTLAAYAELKNVDPEKALAVLNANAKRFLGIE